MLAVSAQKTSVPVLSIGLPKEDKAEMQADLQDLITGVLRKYPALSYFQVSLPSDPLFH
jgi:hypothetical protein